MKTRIAMLVVLLFGCRVWGDAVIISETLDAPDTNSVLILSNSVVGGTSSWESVEAQAAGFTAALVSGDVWATMTTSNFATYRALVLGDARCGGGDYSAAMANTSVWYAAAGAGNAIIMGTDVSYHSQLGNNATGAQTLIKNSIGFAGAQTNGTGFYFAFGCYDGTQVDTILNAFSPGGFGYTWGGYDYCHIVASHAALTGLTDDDISQWHTSVHEIFTNYPSNFMALARTASTSFTNSPAPTSYVYIIAKGEGLVSTEEGDCSLSSIISRINSLSLKQSRKTALIRRINMLHARVVGANCRNIVGVERVIISSFQNYIRLGQVSVSTADDLKTCISQFIGECSTTERTRK